jgi:hypothetical protein
MDATEIRHRNLLVLISTLEGRGVTKNKDQAQQMGALGASYLSQLKGGKKMGDDTARKIETAMRKPRGWMDSAQWEHEKTAPESHSQSVRFDPEIVRDVARALQEVFAELGYEPFDLAHDAELFVELYQRVLERGEIASGSNMVWLGTRIKERARLGAPSDERSKGTHGKGSPAGDARIRQKKA